MHKRPTKIIVLRHAEKPIDPIDQRLAHRGYKRAEYLAEFIPKNFGRPSMIFATEPTKSSFRPFLTMQPLWDAVKESWMDVSIDDEAALHLGHKLRAGDLSVGENVVVCWHHGKIPELMKGLGCSVHDYPAKWPDNDYSTIYVVTYEKGEAVVSQYKQLF
jgi:hypothetical protein